MAKSDDVDTIWTLQAGAPGGDDVQTGERRNSRLSDLRGELLEMFRRSVNVGLAAELDLERCPTAIRQFYDRVDFEVLLVAIVRDRAAKCFGIDAEVSDGERLE